MTSSMGRAGRLASALAAAVALSAALIGCASGGTSPTPASPSSTASRVAPGEDPALEALLPDEIGGETTQKLSMTGAALVGNGTPDPTFTEFIERIGAEPQDVSVAMAFTPANDTQAYAYRVAGADPETLLREFQASVDATDLAAEVTWESATLGGKEVQAGRAPEATDASIYLYPAGETIFIIVASDAGLAAEVIAAFP